MASKMDSKNDERIPVDILYDLISRFIINIPADERKNIVRICFQIEIAHWFYLDFYCTENPQLKTCTMKEFTILILKYIPDMQHHLKNVDSILTEWREYKKAVPTYGAIVLDEDLTHVLLVQSYFAKSSWGFPKGKVNEEEPPARCAVREVFEETGFDISNKIDEHQFIEITWNEQVTRLYLISGVNRNTVFRPRTRMEIKAVEWFPLADLPDRKKSNTKEATTPKPNNKKGPTNPNNFFMVLPFVKRIRQWVNQRQPRRQRHKSVTDADMLGRQHRTSTCENGDTQPKLMTQQQMFAAVLQDEVQDYKQLRQQRAGSTGPGNTPQSAPPRAQGPSRRDKASIKRQLFTGDEEKNGLVGRAQQNGGKSNGARGQNGSTPKQAQPFSARAWTNFKFDRAIIYAAMPPLRPVAGCIFVVCADVLPDNADMQIYICTLELAYGFAVRTGCGLTGIKDTFLSR